MKHIPTLIFYILNKSYHLSTLDFLNKLDNNYTQNPLVLQKNNKYLT